MAGEWPDGWRAPEKHEAIAIASELRVEIGNGHALHNQELKLIARRDDQDDVLVMLQDGRVAQVHVTWRGSVEQDSNWPTPKLFRDLAAWHAAQLDQQ